MFQVDKCYCSGNRKLYGIQELPTRYAYSSDAAMVDSVFVLSE